MEELKACPLCGGSNFKKQFDCIDYTVSKETFSVQSCLSCGFVFTNPRPAPADLGKYYKSDTYISHSDTSKGIVNKLYKLVRGFTLMQKYRLVQPYLEPNTLLDIGCGTGAFLNQCTQLGAKAIGIEPDPDARMYGIETYKIDIRPEEALNEMPDGSFSVITMWHVLEHVVDLHGRVEEIYRLLKADGRAFIAVPNHLSYDAQFYGKDWAAYDVPRHLYHFDIQSVSLLFEGHGMVVDQVLPMKFDSYYVSLLSEEIKTGNRNFISGMFRGMVSQMKAKTNSWSSQIYVIRKK